MEDVKLSLIVFNAVDSTKKVFIVRGEDVLLISVKSVFGISPVYNNARLICFSQKSM